MQENKSSIDINSTLSSLLNLVYKSDILENGTTFEKVKFLNQENEIVSNLSIEVISELLFTIRKNFSYKDSMSLLEDISKQDVYNPYYERLIYLLTALYHKKLVPYKVEDAPIVLSIKCNYYVIEDIEIKIRKIFSFLLDKHIGASKTVSKTYLDFLNRLKHNMKIKYYGIVPDGTLETIRLDKNNRNLIINNYIDALVMGIGSKLLSISDEMLEQEYYYAQGIAYQLLLRSLFILISDYNRISMYETAYQGLIKENSISSNIIKMAFISHNDDLLEYSTRKKVKISDNAI